MSLCSVGSYVLRIRGRSPADGAQRGARGVAASVSPRLAFSTSCISLLCWKISADCYTKQPCFCVVGGQLSVLKSSASSLGALLIEAHGGSRTFQAAQRVW